MNWAPDSPTELPNGRLVCGSHGLVVCGRCCVDYSFMDDVLGHSDGEDSTDSIEELMRQQEEEAHALGHIAALNGYDPDPLGHMKLSRGNGRVLPTVFLPPRSATPQSLFPVGIGRNAIPNVIRFIRADDPKSLLIYTDGACLGNGQADPRAGWSFVFRPVEPNTTASIKGRLEHQGPFGDPHDQTSNRAELRAIIGALRFRDWDGEGFQTLVLATDSEYVVKGATEWVRGWLRKGWRTSTGDEVKNKDMWEALLGEMDRWDKRGVKIQFWRIPREWNTDADRLAKEGAQLDELYKFQEKLGFLY